MAHDPVIGVVPKVRLTIFFYQNDVSCNRYRIHPFGFPVRLLTDSLCKRVDGGRVVPDQAIHHMIIIANNLDFKVALIKRGVESKLFQSTTKFIFDAKGIVISEEFA